MAVLTKEIWGLFNTREKFNFMMPLPDSKKLNSRGLICGVGINDCPKPSNVRIDGSRFYNPCYITWTNMMKRCYSSEYHKTKPSYKDTKVASEWHSYLSFKAWWENNFREGYHLDKDLLSDENTYSPTNCLFVPPWLNMFINSNDKIRGDFPVGVSYDKTNNNFVAQVCKKSGRYLGRFSTQEEASSSWREAKNSLAFCYKQQMDELDSRIYLRVLSIIGRMK